MHRPIAIRDKADGIDSVPTADAVCFSDTAPSAAEDITFRKSYHFYTLQRKMGKVQGSSTAL